MASFVITDHSTGKRYKVTAPSKDEAMAEFNRQHPQEGSGGILDQMAAAGKHTREAVMHPLQSAEDAARTLSNFVTFGARDRLAPALGSGRTYEQEKAETSAADTRLGTWDEALNMGAALAQPSVAAKALPEGASLLRSAGAYGSEGALQGATSAAIQGDSPTKGALTGAAFGAGGSLLGQSIGRGFNVGEVPNPLAGEKNLLGKAGDFVEPLANASLGKTLLTDFGATGGLATKAKLGAKGLNWLGNTRMGRQAEAFANQGVAETTRDALAKMLIGMGRQ